MVESKQTNKPKFQIFTGFILAVLLICCASFSFADQISNIRLSPKSIEIIPTRPGITFLMLRVMDPHGSLVHEATSTGTALTWSLTDHTSDGLYSYEIRAGFTASRQVAREDNRSTVAPTKRTVQSGGFLVQNGEIQQPETDAETGFLRRVPAFIGNIITVAANFIAQPAYADIVHLDDVIINGSECVGMDCVNGESFGFDTLILKENNLRIYFRDTSNSASFPTTDWRITINDSANGGGNFFRIDDVNAGRSPFTIEATAPSHSLYVDDYGRVGIGTSTPIVEVHVADSDTPTLRLEQDGSGGWTPQTWDVAGNEANFFIRDVTNGSKLAFRIQASTPADTLCLKNNGQVGIGTWSPTQELHVEGNVYVSGNMELGSSRKIKEKILPLQLTDALLALKNLQPVRFHYKRNPNEESLGFIAEDVPDLVATTSRTSLSTMDVVAVLTKVIQQQQQTIDSLARKVDKLAERSSVQGD